MDVVEQFTVAQRIDSVWSLFQDVSELVRCLPGAEIASDNGDGSFNGRVSVKLGPISASFDGTATVEFDDETHTSNIKGRGIDRSGGSRGTVDVNIRLIEADVDHTDVTIDAKVTLAGPIAQFGRTGLINEMSKRLIDDFSACVHAKLDADSAQDVSAIVAPELRGLSLLLSSMWGVFVAWWKRLFSHTGT
ncbi:carbon monoxide dehydrogenase subunit G [bacterium BMS3Abin02]|nr:carbon monoxide dehydrogenase subunit G [bacterium BMS3Abin02]GBE21808.1 carbon monoxide dehydrogenase subunit G [bacterium BMS3Bbin01]HDH26176.1 hypothetical protein [Actinomycetota bacterium]HDL50323.1 hypothetical protein [Actinomycetota bacterium]